MASAPTACPNTSRRNRGIVPAPREAGPCSVNGTPQFRFVCAGIQIEERRGIKNGFLYCCSRAEGYEGRHHCRQNRSAYSCCNDLWDCRIHPIGVVPRLLLVHLRSGVRWRLCFSRSLYLFFSCVRGTKKEAEKSPSSARISSIFLFAIHHGSSWPVHNL